MEAQQEVLLPLALHAQDAEGWVLLGQVLRIFARSDKTAGSCAGGSAAHLREGTLTP